MIDHVTNKALSIKLKEAGFEQGSLWHWDIQNDVVVYFTQLKSGQRCVSAYLATELLTWLPDIVNIKGNEYQLTVKFAQSKCYVRYDQINSIGWVGVFRKAPTLQDALAEMLLCLKEEGLV